MSLPESSRLRRRLNNDGLEHSSNGEPVGDRDQGPAGAEDGCQRWWVQCEAGRGCHKTGEQWLGWKTFPLVVFNEEVHLETKSSKEVSGREEHGPSGRTKNSVPHELLLFAFSASNAWLLPDDAAGQPEGDGEAEDECCRQRGAKRRGEDGGEENEEEREQPEQETEKERVERRVAWNKPEPCHCEDEAPDQGG